MSITLLEGRYLIHLLYSVIHNMKPSRPPANMDWGMLYKLSYYHKMSTISYYGIDKLDDGDKPPQDIMTAFYKDYKKGIAKEAVQHIVIEQLLKAFEDNSIDCMPLKGYLIKNIYPKPDMRQMADIDILFKNEQSEQVRGLMLGMGFTEGFKGAKHDAYYKEPFMNIEMHHRLIAENSKNNEYFCRVWDRARLKDGCSFIYELLYEDFLIYMTAHIGRHFANSGTGIRSILDIWLYIQQYKNQMDWRYIQSELEKIELWEFTKNLLGLGEIWFENREGSELHNELGRYVISCGIYGTVRHSIASSIGQTVAKGKGGNVGTLKLMYWLKLFFPGLKQMKILYPFLVKLPFLLPVGWLLRGAKCIFLRTKHTLQVINNTISVSRKDIIKIQNLHEKAGLEL